MMMMMTTIATTQNNSGTTIIYGRIFFLPMALGAQWRAMAPSFLRFSRSHTTTHHSRQDSSGRVISPSQRPLPDNTQHSQQTNIHALGRIRTHNLGRRAATGTGIKGHQDDIKSWFLYWRFLMLVHIKLTKCQIWQLRDTYVFSLISFLKREKLDLLRPHAINVGDFHDSSI